MSTVLSADHVVAYLSYLANKRDVTINTKKTALNALAFTFRHYFATELLINERDIRTVQELLGQHFAGTSSPLDNL
jgi:site-specific recombinase XerD